MDAPGTRRRIAIRDHLELHVVEHVPAEAGGRRAGDTFVLVHGLASNARTWDGVGQALRDAGHTAFAVDLRGHGRSSKPDEGYETPRVAEDVCRLVERLGGGPVVLAGQSWGGNVVIEAAASCPERIAAVAGIDGGAIRLREAYPDWARCAAELAPPPIAGMPADALEARLQVAHPDWPESGIAGTLANFEVRDDGTVAPWLTRERHMRILRGLWEHDPLAVLPRLTMPSLLILAGPGRHGRVERFRERWYRDAAAALPRGELVELPDADHDVHAQHPARIAELLLSLAQRMHDREVR